MRIIDADQLEGKMYHEAFENDVSYDERNPMARWDSGLWIRYKMFENCLENTPTIDAADRPQGEWIRTDGKERVMIELELAVIILTLAIIGFILWGKL